MTDPNPTPAADVPDEVDPTDPEWELDADESVGDAENPHRNDDEEAAS